MSETLYSNPSIPLIESPIGLDKEIQTIQQALAVLPWLDKSFGRAWTGRSKELSKLVIYPEVYQGTGEYLNVLPNDHLKAQSFIKVQDDKQRITDYVAQLTGVGKIICIVDLIFWFNLERINVSRTYRFNEELKKNVKDIIRTLPQLRPLTIYEGAEDVFKGYTIDHADQQTLKHPYGGFRFECELNYRDEC